MVEVVKRVVLVAGLVGGLGGLLAWRVGAQGVGTAKPIGSLLGQTDANGALVVGSVPTYATPHSGAYTTTQTGATVWTPAAGKKAVITLVDIQVSGTTAGTVRVWCDMVGHTTYTAGTDYSLSFFDPSTPSATFAPGKVFPLAVPIACAVNGLVRVTTSAGVTVEVNVQGLEQ